MFSAIDWTAGYRPLVTELSEIIRDSELGPTVADRLFQVTLKSGDAIWLAVHIEIQSQYDSNLPRRMFMYHYRIGDRFNVPVVSLAILGDESPKWKPTQYVSEQFGTGIQFRFHTVKLLDWADRLDLSVGNPIVFVIAAHLQSLQTAGHPNERKLAKWSLIREIIDAGGTPERIRKLYRLIDWFLELPVELQESLRSDIKKYEEERFMPYVTSDERIALDKGLLQGRVEGRVEGTLDGIELFLRYKFGPAGQAFTDQLRASRPTLEQLTKIKNALEVTSNLDELRQLLN